MVQKCLWFNSCISTIGEICVTTLFLCVILINVLAHTAGTQSVAFVVIAILFVGSLLSVALYILGIQHTRNELKFVLYELNRLQPPNGGIGFNLDYNHTIFYNQRKAKRYVLKVLNDWQLEISIPKSLLICASCQARQTYVDEEHTERCNYCSSCRAPFEHFNNPDHCSVCDLTWQVQEGQETICLRCGNRR